MNVVVDVAIAINIAAAIAVAVAVARFGKGSCNNAGEMVERRNVGNL